VVRSRLVRRLDTEPPSHFHPIVPVLLPPFLLIPFAVVSSPSNNSPLALSTHLHFDSKKRFFILLRKPLI
jgi:hypothetical protein